MLKRVAVMDLGTNTFHLLIAEGVPSSYKELHHDHAAVKLGEGGINKGLIQPDAFERGLACMCTFRRHIDKFGITDIRAIATSALRSAANGNQFIQEVKTKAGINIETINGDKEAEYIFYGVKTSGILNKNLSLVLDIGGGSIEFIIADEEKIYWKKSFEVGAARLMDKFHQTDPIPAEAVVGLQQYLDEFIAEFYDAAARYNIANIIGSSGAFETFAELIEADKGNEFDLTMIKAYQFEQTALHSLFYELIHSSHQQRVNNKNILPVRVDMIVVAAIVTQHLMQKLSIQAVEMSVYSLKEGVLAAMLS